MGRRINWDSANRQAKLRKWIRDNGNNAWIDELPPHVDHELDRWAKLLVQRSVRRVRSKLREQEMQENSISWKIDNYLKNISQSLEIGQMLKAKNYAEELLNLSLKQEISSIEKNLRIQITETISLLFLLSE